MLALKPDTRLALGNDIMIQSIPGLGHYYVFDLESGDHFQVNHTAYWVLEAIGTGLKLADLKLKFAGRFELEAETVEKDLAEVIRFAIENHIIKEMGHEKS
jgi:hypothetical protein